MKKEITIREISENTTTSFINAYNKEYFRCEINNERIKAIFDCYEGCIRMYDINSNTVKMISTASKREHFIEEVHRYLNRSLINRIDMYRTDRTIQVKYIDVVHEGIRYIACANVSIMGAYINSDGYYIRGQGSTAIYDDVIYGKVSSGGWAEMKDRVPGLKYQAYKDIRIYVDNILKQQNKELKSRYL